MEIAYQDKDLFSYRKKHKNYKSKDNIQIKIYGIKNST